MKKMTTMVQSIKACRFSSAACCVCAAVATGPANKNFQQIETEQGFLNFFLPYTTKNPFSLWRIATLYLKALKISLSMRYPFMHFSNTPPPM